MRLKKKWARLEGLRLHEKHFGKVCSEAAHIETWLESFEWTKYQIIFLLRVQLRMGKSFDEALMSILGIGEQDDKQSVRKAG